MDTKQIMPGTRSYSIERVTPELFKEHSGQFLYMIQEYFKSGSERNGDPISMFNEAREKLAEDERFFMLAPVQNGIPVGMLMADTVRDAARITVGYIHQAIKPQVKNMIISDTLSSFEEWARSKNCRVQIFYTNRTPGAHKMMTARGWEYELSIYKKELNHGK